MQLNAVSSMQCLCDQGGHPTKGMTQFDEWEAHMRRFIVLASCWMTTPVFAEGTMPVEVKFHEVKAVKQKRTVVPSWSKLSRPIVCKLDFEVDRAGIPSSVVPSECPEELHKNVVKSSLKWEFEPHEVDGQPVPIKFRMVLKITH